MDKQQIIQLLENSPSFFLDNFEGPLELLLYLIQKEEVNICEIPIKELTQQFFSFLEKFKKIDQSSDLLLLTSTLLLIKSRRLLSNDETSDEEQESLLKVELFYHLLEYCKVKECANELASLEEKQKSFFSRPPTLPQKKEKFGLQEISLEELNLLLKNLLEKAKPSPNLLIEEERWHVSTKIEWFKNRLQLSPTLLFNDAFDLEKSKDELVVIFLALLELIKIQMVKVVREGDTLYINVHLEK